MADWVRFVLDVVYTQRVNACYDEDDNVVIECALAAEVDVIVTGDADLLTSHSFGVIPIVTPGEFVRDVLKIG